MKTNFTSNIQTSKKKHLSTVLTKTSFLSPFGLKLVSRTQKLSFRPHEIDDFLVSRESQKIKNFRKWSKQKLK